MAVCYEYLEQIDKVIRGPWGRFNIQMPSYKYKDSHYKDKTVSRHGNHIHENGLSTETRPCTCSRTVPLQPVTGVRILSKMVHSRYPWPDTRKLEKKW